MQASWSDFNIHPTLISSLVNDFKFAGPTTIQAEVLPYSKPFVDLLITSPTGSGKTFAYLLPVLSDLLENRQEDSSMIDALILLPTRELAVQVYNEIVRLLVNEKRNNSKEYRPCLLVGGMSKEKQLRILNEGSRIVVSTPGRLLDMINSEQRLMYLSGVKWLVLDEIDRIIDLGQFEDLSKVFKFMFDEVPRRQKELRNIKPQMEFAKDALEDQLLEQNVVMFNTTEEVDTLFSDEDYSLMKRRLSERRTIVISATLTQISHTSRMMTNKKFKKFLAKKKKEKTEGDQSLGPKILDIMRKVRTNHKLQIVDLTKDTNTILPSRLQISKIRCQPSEKFYYLFHFLRTIPHELVIIFVNSISSAKKVKNVLEELGIPCTNLHSHMTQPQRLKKMLNFASGKRQVLVSTDVASRGLDIRNVSLVIHFHLPKDLDTFIHRSGRTARQEQAGSTLIIGDSSDQKRWSQYAKNIDQAKIDYPAVDTTEVYRYKAIVDKALLIEQKSYANERDSKEEKSYKRLSKQADIDISDDEPAKKKKLDDEPMERKREKGIVIKDVREEKKRLRNDLELQKYEVEKRYSTFLSPYDIQLINSQFKRVKQH